MQVVFTSDFDPADGAIRGLSRDPVLLIIFLTKTMREVRTFDIR